MAHCEAYMPVQVGVKLHEEEIDRHRRPCAGLSLQCHDAGALLCTPAVCPFDVISCQGSPHLFLYAE